MPVWAWVIVAIAAVAVVGVVMSRALAARRTGRLQEQFGPEYDRTVDSSESRREAEAELDARAKRREQLDIRPLAPSARDRYIRNWQVVQADFVDSPRAAVSAADSLIQSVMSERGYPVEDFDSRASDISVDHPQVVESYREGHRLAQGQGGASGGTESLRQAMQHFRTLFEELVDDGAEAAVTRHPDDAEVPGDRTRV